MPSESDQESLLRYWRCPNCGQVHFADTPPDMCDFCRDLTTWELLQAREPDDQPRNEFTVKQLRLL